MYSQYVCLVSKPAYPKQNTQTRPIESDRNLTLNDVVVCGTVQIRGDVIKP